MADGVLSTLVANVISLDRVSKGYGSAGPLLTEVSLGLGDSDRIGVVGLNGAGKSTLLRLLTKAEEPDSGRVTHRRDLRVLSLPQTLDLAPAATVRDVVVGHAWLPAAFAAEHEWAGDAGVRTVLIWTWHARPWAGHRRSDRCPEASVAGSRWRRCWFGRATCCCSTSRPTTSTSPASTGSPHT